MRSLLVVAALISPAAQAGEADVYNATAVGKLTNAYNECAAISDDQNRLKCFDNLTFLVAMAVIEAFP